MATRKIELMHQRYGKQPGMRCGDCCHLYQSRYKGKEYTKCDVYGLSHSEATDWAKRYAACGLCNKATREQDVVLLVKPDRKKDEMADGQLSLLGG